MSNKHKPLLLTTHDVQAIQAGRKSVFRKEVKPQPIGNYKPVHYFPDHKSIGFVNLDLANPYDDTFTTKAPYQAGDILYGKETIWEHGRRYTSSFDETGEYETRWFGTGKHSYAATDEKPASYRTKSSPQMPIEAARIWLEVTGVRVERLQDITPNDAGDEGIECINIDLHTEPGAMHADYKNYLWRDDEKYEDYHFPYYANPIDSFKSLYIKNHGLDLWLANRWHWVVEFKVLSTTGKPTI